MPMFFAGILMMFKNPDLLKSRLCAKEKRKEQGLVVKLSGLMFVSGFVTAGLGVRFHWYILPTGVVIGAAMIFLRHIFFMQRYSVKILTYPVPLRCRRGRRLLIPDYTVS